MTALHDALRIAARVIAERQPMEHEIDELARGAAGLIENEVRRLMAEKRRAVWIEPRIGNVLGKRGQLIDKRCTHKPIAYTVTRKGD